MCSWAFTLPLAMKTIPSFRPIGTCCNAGVSLAGPGSVYVQTRSIVGLASALKPHIIKK